MKYLLNNISEANFYLNVVSPSTNVNNDKLNNANTNKTIIYKPISKFGEMKYKSKLSRLYLTKRKNVFFSKSRQLKSILTNVKRIDFSTENGFFFELLLVGLGFKVIRLIKKNMLFFELHFSHKLYYNVPLNVSVRCIKKKIVLFGIDKAQLVNIVEQIKSLRYPNTYKGKGIKYFDEVIKLKPGKQR